MKQGYETTGTIVTDEIQPFVSDLSIMSNQEVVGLRFK